VFHLTVGVSIVDDDILPFHVPELMQPLPERPDETSFRVARSLGFRGHEDSDARRLPRLRVRVRWREQGRRSDKRDDCHGMVRAHARPARGVE